MTVGFALDLRHPNLPFLSLAQILLVAAALTGGFEFARAFYLWGVALALHSPLTQGLSLTEGEGVELVGRTRRPVGFAVGGRPAAPDRGSRTPVGRDIGPAAL